MSAYDWSPEAESSVLGGLLVMGAEAYDAAAQLVQADSFADKFNAAAWTAAAALIVSGKPADAITVNESMQAAGTAKESNFQWLAEMAQTFISVRVVRQHAEILAQKALSRRLMAATVEACDIAHDKASPIKDRIAAVSEALEGVDKQESRGEPQEIGSFVVGFLDRLQDLADGNVVPGIQTGISGLDYLLGGGLKPGKQYVVAARPSVGKSSFTQQILQSIAEQGIGAAMLSQEMEGDELTQRTVSNMGRVRMDGLIDGKLQDDEWGRVAEAVERMRSLPLYLDEQAGLTLQDISRKARFLVRRHKIKVLGIDYLQLCAGAKEGDSRHHEIEKISRGTKVLAKQLGISIILISQLNREVEKRVGGRPVLADLKESGAIEEDADAVLMLYRFKPGIVGCVVPKNRQGKTGDVALQFEGEYQRWSMSHESLSPTEKPKLGSSKFSQDY